MKNKIKGILLTIVLSILFISGIYAQNPGDTLWTKTYGGANSDMGWCVQQADDEGYIITGWTESYGAGGYDIYLIKTDAAGDTMWTKTYGEDGSDDGRCVRQTPDGGYVIAGNTQPIGIMGSYVWLIKTNSYGDTLWTKKWGETPVPNINTGRCVQLTSDGGYIISGHSQFLGPNNEDVYLIKTDANGNQEWVNFYGGTGYEIGYWTQQTSDEGYIIVGYTTSFGSGMEDVYLIKTDASGTVEWTKIYGGTGTDSGFSVQQTSDDGYIIAGFTDSFGQGSYDAYIIKTNAAGDTVWTKTYGGAAYDKAYSIQAISDGTYIVSGTTRSFEDSSGDVYLLKLDSSGDTLWTETYNNGNDDRGWSVQQTSDNNYIIAGFSALDYYMLKIAGEPTGIESYKQYDKQLLSQSYPNPFSLETTISFSLNEASYVSIDIYNIEGKKIKSLLSSHLDAGRHNIVWKGTNESGEPVRKGVYFYKIKAEEHQAVKMMIMIN
ncbi:MAG: T9SS type A sorting domain-containing protein [Bacteroidales bacterium]|nr:T9SS type A sorting domain-containing protein [Bacteroidales bacterium]